MNKRSKIKGKSGHVRHKATPKKSWAWVGVLVVVLFVIAVRLRALGVPLERDEGEYAYAGQLILQGIPPYLKVYNMKLPGVYAAYALILAAFGQTHHAIRLGLLFVNVATIILLFMLGKRLFGDFVGLVAGISFGLFSLLHAALGLFAHATHFVVASAVAGLLVLVTALDNRRTMLLFWSGFLLGIAFVMKQHGIFFAFFALSYLVYHDLSHRIEWRDCVKRAGFVVLGLVLPFVFTCIILAWAGAFGKFWFWTFTYAREYGTQVPFRVGILELLIPKMGRLLLSAVLLWCLALLGFCYHCSKVKVSERSVFCVGLSIFSFLAITPGLYFREHYFILLLPAAALTTGAGTEFLRELLLRRFEHRTACILAGSIFCMCAASLVFQERQFLFEMTPTQMSRTIYGGNPFPESIQIAKYIRSQSAPSDEIAVLGSEPQIYFYARRRSACGFIYMYPMMEVHSYAGQMQKEMREALTRERPKFLVTVNVATSWGAREGSDLSIVEWADKWASQNYELVGVVDIVSMDHTEYRWGRQAKEYSPLGNNVLFVLRRKELKPRGEADV